MDRRRLLLCASSLLSGCLGCMTTHTPITPGAIDPTVTVRKAEDLPKRNPKAETCVAYGNYRVGEAADPKTPAAARQDLQDQARKAYQQALSLNPNYVPAYLGLANLYLVQEDFPRAFETYKKALQKQPKEAQLWEALGMAHARKKEWEPALTALKRAAELDPENRNYTRTLGLCLARAGHNDESVACLSKVMNPADANLYVARMLQHLQHPDESRRYAVQAVQLKPDLAEAREFLAHLNNPGTTPQNSVVTVGFEESQTRQ